MKTQRLAVYVPFHLPNHRWNLGPVIEPHWRDPAHLVCDRGTAVLVRNVESSATSDDTPESRLQKPNQDSPPVDLCCEAEYLVSLIFNKARKGNAECAQWLGFLAHDTTIKVRELAQKKPKLLRPLAKKYYGWPVIKSKLERLSNAEKDLFARIQLGEDAIVELDAQTSKFKFDQAGRIAYRLLRHIDGLRTTKHFRAGEVGVAARELIPFSDDTSEQWWMVAKSALLESYPKPETVDEFKQLVTAPSKTKSPGRHRQAIIEMIKHRFRSLAPNTAYQT